MGLPPRSSSAGLRSIRRELQRRRSKPLAPTKSVAKKTSASPPPRNSSSDAVRDSRYRPPHREMLSSTTSHSRCSTVTDASPQPRRSSSRCTPTSPPPPLSAPCRSNISIRSSPLPSMPMYPPPSSSSGMRSIRRELQHRRAKPLAPTKSIAKKTSASPPPCHGSSDAVRGPLPRPPHREIPSSTTSRSRGSTVTDASPQPRRPRASSPPPPPPLSAPSSASSARGATPVFPTQLKPGMVVRVRSRTATLKTGQILVLCFKATIVSICANGGYEVIYDANWPRGDPKNTIHVAPNQIKVINPSPSPTMPTARSAAVTTKKEMPRPTTAGKSLRLIRSLFPTMELPTRA